VNCSKFTGACSQCAQATGCSCIMQGEGTGICQGPATCEMQPDMFACELFTNCSWVPFLCKGTPTACDQLSLTNCALTDGCQVDLMAGPPMQDRRVTSMPLKVLTERGANKSAAPLD
jgi:hypothetical protein